MEISCCLSYIFFAFLFYKALRWVIFGLRMRANRQKGHKCRQDRDAKKYEFPPENKEVLKCNTIRELVKGQFEKRFTSKDIVSTFASRCYTIGRKLNLTADEIFDTALEEAERKDKQLRECLDRKGDPYTELGKLHGIPFGVKEMIHVAGTLSTNGFGSLADQVIQSDNPTVAVFKANGAIPLVKTNVPLGCLAYHTKNDIWGEAKNPWNSERTCGGSSGGDAGLLAARCLPFSIGSDLAGSLRVPAHF